jgi:hypothetical protein
VDVKAVLALLGLILAVALELTLGWSSIRRSSGSVLRQAGEFGAAESALLVAVSLGMSFVIVFMLGPALGEVLKSAAR